jgi:uncharacterized protein (TIGR02246 family)
LATTWTATSARPGAGGSSGARRTRTSRSGRWRGRRLLNLPRAWPARRRPVRAAPSRPGCGASRNQDAIRRLFEEYRRALDERDFDAYTRLFTEDGVFVTNRRSYEGREEIREMLEQLPGGAADGPRGLSVHLLANPVVDVDGDGATAEVTWAFIVGGEGDTPALRMLGRYRDVLRREGGTWKFTRRDARADIPSS